MKVAGIRRRKMRRTNLIIAAAAAQGQLLSVECLTAACLTVSRGNDVGLWIGGRHCTEY